MPPQIFSTGVTVPSTFLNGLNLPVSYVVFANAGTVYAKSQFYSGTDYSGSDAATVINQALNGLTANRTWKEKIVVKGGKYTINSPIKIPSYTSLDLSGVQLQADAGGLLAATTHYCILQIGPTDGSPVSTVDVIGGILDGNLQAVNGVYFNTFGGNSVSDTWLYEVLMKNGGRDAGFLIGGTDNLLMNCVCDTFTPQGPGTTTGGFYVTSTITSRCQLIGCTARNGARANNISANGFVADDGTSRITWNGCTSYNNAGTGFLLVASTGTHGKEWGVFNCRSMENINSSSQPKGYSISYCDGLQVQNSSAVHNGGDGFLVDNCPDALVSTNLSKNNTVNSTPNGGGIRTTNSSRISLIGNKCYDDQTPQLQSYGIILDTASASIIAQDNTVLNNLTGGIQVNAGTNHTIRNNLGYNPQAASNVTAGASIWTYTNNDNYDETMVLNNLNGGTVSAISYKGDAGYPTTVNGYPFFLQPTQTIAVTWATTAPTFRKYPQ